ncbi:nuclear transport factor 2 family protein [Dietzia cinnamea]|uniref:Nuclear transport factor 2 family protein n=1 Tax=Dietzia cinnamea TaxID=321318 RepID=A0ABV3YM65_9ACTN|nr:nuclear transport factor 2 family protein [Dietzia cinnamea]
MDIAELLELEHQGWSSLCDRSGADFYGRLMTPDGVMVLAHGQVLDRAEVVTSLNDALPWRTYEISDERLVELNDDAVALVYTGRASRGDGDEFHALMSTVYRRRHGRWRLALPADTHPTHRVILRCQQSTPSSRRHAGGSSWSGP